MAATAVPAAAVPAAPLGDAIPLHTVHYAASTSPIKDDIAQLAACWKSGSGALTKQEAGLLLTFHSRRDEDGRAEVLGAGVVGPCLEALDSSTALTADKSSAAGLLLSLCADEKGREQVAKSKVGGANGASCCAVLHGCLVHPDTTPRHVVALLATLASSPVSLAVILKTLTAAGGVPWRNYSGMLEHCCAPSTKDHTTATHTANMIQQLVSGREALAADAAEAGVLRALLAAAAAHKSAAAVGAATSCLLSLCQAAPDVTEQLGQLPGAVQIVVDLLGPPPATIIAWEQQQLAQSCAREAAAASCEGDHAQQTGKFAAAGSVRIPSGSGSSSTQGVRGVREQSAESLKVRVSRTGAAAEVSPTADSDGSARNTSEEQQGTGKTRRKSLRIVSVAEGDALTPTAGHTGSDASSPTLRSKSLLGCKQSPTGLGASQSTKATPWSHNASSAMLRSPPLSSNSTALKWGGPVPPATRTAAAGLLAQLVQLPRLREAASDRLATPRLAGLLNSTMQQLAEAGKKGKGGAKKGSSSSKLAPEPEQLLTHICCCLEFLVAGSSADSYRVAAAGCAAVVQLASDARNTQLRRAAKAVVAQVMLLAKAQQYVQQAEVPEELVAVAEGSVVLLRLTDSELRQLLVEVPDGASLTALDDVIARARC